MFIMSARTIKMKSGTKDNYEIERKEERELVWIERFRNLDETD